MLSISEVLFVFDKFKKYIYNYFDSTLSQPNYNKFAFNYGIV